MQDLGDFEVQKKKFQLALTNEDNQPSFVINFTIAEVLNLVILNPFFYYTFLSYLFIYSLLILNLHL